MKDERKVIDVDVFGGPPGAYGFRRGTWKATLDDGGTLEFYCSIPHALTIEEQRARLLQAAECALQNVEQV